MLFTQFWLFLYFPRHWIDPFCRKGLVNTIIQISLWSKLFPAKFSWAQRPSPEGMIWIGWRFCPFCGSLKSLHFFQCTFVFLLTVSCCTGWSFHTGWPLSYSKLATETWVALPSLLISESPLLNLQFTVRKFAWVELEETQPNNSFPFSFIQVL